MNQDYQKLQAIQFELDYSKFHYTFYYIDFQRKYYYSQTKDNPYPGLFKVEVQEDFTEPTPKELFVLEEILFVLESQKILSWPFEELKSDDIIKESNYFLLFDQGKIYYAKDLTFEKLEDFYDVLSQRLDDVYGASFDEDRYEENDESFDNLLQSFEDDNYDSKQKSQMFDSWVTNSENIKARNDYYD